MDTRGFQYYSVYGYRYTTAHTYTDTTDSLRIPLTKDGYRLFSIELNKIFLFTDDRPHRSFHRSSSSTIRSVCDVTLVHHFSNKVHVLCKMNFESNDCKKENPKTLYSRASIIRTPVVTTNSYTYG